MLVVVVESSMLKLSMLIGASSMVEMLAARTLVLYIVEWEAEERSKSLQSHCARRDGGKKEHERE